MPAGAFPSSWKLKPQFAEALLPAGRRAPRLRVLKVCNALTTEIGESKKQGGANYLSQIFIQFHNYKSPVFS